MLVNIHTHTIRDGEITISTIGIHPWNVIAGTDITEDVTQYDAVGEIGLDGAHADTMQIQEYAFHKQLEIAEQYQKAVVIHCVRRFEQTMKILEGFQLPGVIFHGFMGSHIQMERAIKRGYFLSYGERTFLSKRAMDALRSTPLENLFFETDTSCIGVVEVYAKAAALTGRDMEELANATFQNYKRLFDHE
ncbi:MAG: TatD family hydrolase [Alistipes sp.]|nr:TatD family hydrolase [Candidatus Alistipes equi]